MSKRTSSQAMFKSRSSTGKKARFTPAQRSEIARVIRSKADKRQCNYNGNGSVSNSGTIISMLQRLTKGDSAVNQYSGEFVDWVWARLRVINRVEGTTDKVDSIRTILFQWDDSVAPTVGNVIDLSNGVEPIVAPYRWGNRRICKILSDQTVTCVSDQSNDHVVTKVFIPGSRIRKSWFGQADTPPVKGGIYVLQVTDSLVAPHPIIEVAFEAVFTDDI